VPTVGTGVKEIRVHDRNELRVMYVAKFTEAVYVLHAFVKKTRQTSKADIELARIRYKKLIATRQR
jgi:phage-related protein